MDQETKEKRDMIAKECCVALITSLGFYIDPNMVLVDDRTYAEEVTRYAYIYADALLAESEKEKADK